MPKARLRGPCLLHKVAQRVGEVHFREDRQAVGEVLGDEVGDLSLVRRLLGRRRRAVRLRLQPKEDGVNF